MSTCQAFTSKPPWYVYLPALLGSVLGAQGLLTPGGQTAHYPTLPSEDQGWVHLIGALLLTTGLLGSLFWAGRHTRRVAGTTVGTEGDRPNDEAPKENSSHFWPQQFSLRTLIIAVVLCASLVGLMYRGNQWQLERTVGAEYMVRTFFLSIDGSRLITFHQDGSSCVWDAETGRELVRFAGNSQAIQVGRLSADNQLAASLDVNGVVRVWRIDDGQELLCRTISSLPMLVYFSVDGQHVAAGNEYAVWEIASGKEVDPQNITVYGKYWGRWHPGHNRLVSNREGGVGTWVDTWSRNGMGGFRLPELWLVMFLPALLVWSVGREQPRNCRVR